MAIIIDENKGLFTIHTKGTTYQFKADERKRLIHTYYGARIDDCDLYPVTRPRRWPAGGWK